MNTNLLWNVVMRQAGTIEKSWLEIVQNAIDAKATKMNFKIHNTKFEAYDNGTGMNKEEILEYFEEFGNSSKGDSDLGEFGMGRGQIFAQGQTTWETKTFNMFIDVKKKGLSYILSEVDTNTDGTRINVKLYNKIRFMDKKIERFTEWIKYITQLSITINGVKVNYGVKYDFNDHYGSVKLTADDVIKVYNRGIFVKEEKLGKGAIIVSNKNMRVNFARNDIMDDCPVYNGLLEKTKDLISDMIMKKQSLSYADRKTIINLMREDNKWVAKFKDKDVIATANDNFISIRDVEEQDTIYFSDGKNTHEDDILIEKGYTVLKNNPITRGIMNSVLNLKEKVGDYQELVKDFRAVRQTSVDLSELNNTQRYNFDCTKAVNDLIGDVKTRDLLIAKGMISNANTNGTNVITINVNLLGVGFDVKEVTHLLLHEYSHDNDTTNTDEHGYEYYKRFYELLEKNVHMFGETRPN